MTVDEGFLYTPGSLVTRALDSNPLNKLSDYLTDLWGGYEYDYHAREEMHRLRPRRKGKIPQLLQYITLTILTLTSSPPYQYISNLTHPLNIPTKLLIYTLL